MSEWLFKGKIYLIPMLSTSMEMKSAKFQEKIKCFVFY